MSNPKVIDTRELNDGIDMLKKELELDKELVKKIIESFKMKDKLLIAKNKLIESQDKLIKLLGEKYE